MEIRHSAGWMTVGLAAVGVTAVLTVPTAWAAPDLSPLVDTTCSYQQVVAALNAQDPALANELAQYPAAQARLQRFLAAPVDTRQQMVDEALAAHPQWQSTLSQKAGTPEGQQAQSALSSVTSTCHNY